MCRHVRAFLAHLENDRGNSIATRNQRLAALHSLFRFIGRLVPDLIEHAAQIQAIPLRRTVVPTMAYLEKYEIDALLDVPDRSRAQGRRDYAIILLLYNTGARATEVAQLTVADLNLGLSPSVRFYGKGRKIRMCPLWKHTTKILRSLLGQRIEGPGESPVFLNVRGQPITRYGIHAALGLTVSDTLLLGCMPILVEGVSDQIYLSLIKRYLIGVGKLKFSKEIVFIPTGGVRGMGPVSKLVSSRDDELPFVFLDSDKIGNEYQKNLKNGRYKNDQEKVISMGQFLSGGDYEIEDFIPPSIIISEIDRMYRCDKYFENFFQEKLPIVDQIESWAKINSVKLVDGWKVELARTIQNRFDKYFVDIEEGLSNSWSEMFKVFLTEKKKRS